VAPMWLLCGSSVGVVAPLRLLLRGFCGYFGFLCCSLVLLCNTSVAPRWLLSSASVAFLWLLCCSYVAALRLLYGSCCSSVVLPLRLFCGSSGLLGGSLLLLFGFSVTRLWLLCGFSLCLGGASVAPMWLLRDSSVTPVAPLRVPLRLFCGSSSLLCGFLVLLGGFSVIRLFVVCGSSLLSR
jgi:hypothetical protein